MSNAETSRVYLSVAANLDPESNIPAALVQLRKFVTIEALSKFYRTAAIGRPEQPDYLNGVVRIRTELGPEELKMEVLRPIEARLGRVRTVDRCIARCIDLDILIYEERIINNSELTIPDSDILARSFLTAGILGLAPDIILPGDTRPLAAHINPQLLSALVEDSTFSQKLKEQFAP